jgi:hypothetical protein
MPAGCGLYVNGRKVVLEEGLWDAHAQSLPVHLTLTLYGVGSDLSNDFEITVTDSEIGVTAI